MLSRLQMLAVIVLLRVDRHKFRLLASQRRRQFNYSYLPWQFNKKPQVSQH